MPKIARVEYTACDPDSCPDDICAAARVCTNHALRQTGPGEKPHVDATACHGCFKCLPACPLSAIRETDG